MSEAEGRGQKRRKGAARMSDIPPEVLRALSEGREETVTLVEWLAIDMPTLIENALPQAGFSDADIGRAADFARSVRGEGVTARLKKIANALFEILLRNPQQRGEIWQALASHKSDMVRAWAAYVLSSDREIHLAERLRMSRRFAADQHMAVRECAWDSFRGYVAENLDEGVALLREWGVDDDENIRRCAVEATRPRGVWCRHIEALKKEPYLAGTLLECVRSDSSRYVARSVANWLNDASKTRADWVESTCQRWAGESATKETAWIINHATRTLRKKLQSGK
ncbi:MAG: DNA alkylation repair protein [Deltaproteobacteria bacterium]